MSLFSSLFPTQHGTGRANELWPVLLLLLVVAIPTIGVLWFVGVAVDNQQLASKQRLADAYRSHLRSVHDQVVVDWEQHESDAMEFAKARSRSRVSGAAIDISPDNSDQPRARFLSVLESTDVDAVVCLAQDGTVEYPSVKTPSVEPVADDVRWKDAYRMENEDGNVLGAEEIYRAIAADAKDQRTQVIALQAQVRCLLKSKNEAAAIQMVTNLLAGETGRGQLGPVEDVAANSVIANIELMAIEHVDAGPEFEGIWSRLFERVFSASSHSLPGPQRLFIMKRMSELAPNRIDQRQLRAESIASDYVARQRTRNGSLQDSAGDHLISRFARHAPDMWKCITSDRRLVLFFHEKTISQWGIEAAGKVSLPADTHVELLSPSDENTLDQNTASLPMGPTMPGWQLRLSHRGDRDSAAGVQSISIHIWTGALVVLFTSILGIAIARAFQRQLRVANLKNDLVGTVSHELKTPLASMRLLVETLLDEEQLDETTTREYLHLIDKENVRLSRLIENFLTFSRMDQDKHAFTFEPQSIHDIIDEAVRTLKDRLRGPDCKLTIDLAEQLPEVRGDKDGLVTVFLNLLDNAHKYTENEKEISITAKVVDEGLRVTVSDNGIGLPRAASRRVFERFFQVDQSLVRQGRGCGLGLSIVEYIVSAHGGTITVNSALGRGSSFQVTLPICNDITTE